MAKLVRRCALSTCGKSIAHKHVNAKFCCTSHKDKHHNRVNPRGFYQPTVGGMKAPKGYSGITDQEHQRIMDDYDMSWDAHKDSF